MYVFPKSLNYSSTIWAKAACFIFSIASTDRNNINGYCSCKWRPICTVRPAVNSVDNFCGLVSTASYLFLAEEGFKAVCVCAWATLTIHRRRSRIRAVASKVIHESSVQFECLVATSCTASQLNQPNGALRSNRFDVFHAVLQIFASLPMATVDNRQGSQPCRHIRLGRVHLHFILGLCVRSLPT